MSYLPTGSYEQDLGDVKDTLISFGKKAGGAVLDTFSTIQQQKGREQAAMEIAKAQAAAAAQQRRGGGRGLPNWVIPAAAGGVVLVLILAMRKK